ncbi:hypothetical protein MBLNU459_g3923t2 [Dothideomycetes sp. NU459]
MADDCIYAEHASRGRSRTHLSGVEDATSYAKAPTIEVRPSSTAVAQFGHPDDTQELPSPTVDAIDAPQSTSEGILLHARGAEVYVGGIATLSFLHFLRKALRQDMGPSPFTEYDRQHVMLEVNHEHDGSEKFDVDKTEIQSLVDYYFAATSGLLHLYTRKDVSTILAISDGILPESDVSSEDVAAVQLIIAIGGHCSGTSPKTLRHATEYFTRAQKTAFEGMLESPSLDMIRLFLLMSFYMLGACRRNAAFMYIGIASKAAEALGLHVGEQYHRFSRKEQDLRLRIWKSLRIVESLVTSILGRPCASSSLTTDPSAFEGPQRNSGEDHGLALDATYRACFLIDDMAQNLTHNGNVSSHSAEVCLGKLARWSTSLSSELRVFSVRTGHALSPLEQQSVIGNLHVACVYYFSVMLVTRPFLIAHLTSRLASGAVVDEANSIRNSGDPGAPKLSNACIDSAVYMAQLCHDALQAGILLNNMCFLKAWLFAAGLILGFSLYVLGDGRSDIDTAFAGLLEVLNRLSHSSPQAQQYFDILTSFMDAIEMRRRHLASNARQTNKPYVDKVFTISVDHSSSRNYATPSSGMAEPDEAGPVNDGNVCEINDLAYLAQTTDQQAYDPYDWNLQMGQSFPFSVEPLGMFFDSM